MDGNNLIKAINVLCKVKNIDKEVVFEAIEASLATACKRIYGDCPSLNVVLNRTTGDMNAYVAKKVVEEVTDDFIEISLSDAREIDPNYELGDEINEDVTPKEFGRSAAQSAKQIIVQKLKEAEREKLYNDYLSKERDCETVIVDRVDNNGNVIVKIGKANAILQKMEQIPGEVYEPGQRIKVYILKVVKTSKDPQIKVSRTHYELIKRLFEREVPEIISGDVEIKSIAREAGSRTKMAVYSKVEGLDAVGACVGPNGSRVDAIVNDLNGEKIDIIPWSEDLPEYINAALRPAKVLAVEITESEDEKNARVVVPDNQLSLAIGKEGQNARLAAKLTGWKIDIKSDSQARETNFIDFSSIEDEDEDDNYDSYDE